MDSYIISAIQQLWPDMPISQQLLDRPTPELVFGFYKRFQDTMKELLAKMCTLECAVVEEPKPNSDPIFSMLCFVNKYLKLYTSNQPGVESMSLSLTDFYEPTSKRTKIRFKVLLNVVLFYDEKLATVQEVVMRELQRTEVLAKKKKEKEALKEKLAQEAERLACTDDRLNKVQKEEEKANLRYKNLEKQKVDKELYHENIRRELQQFSDTYSHKQTLSRNLKANIQRLYEQIITEDSYKTLLDLKENLVHKSAELELEVESLNKNLGERNPELDRFQTINKGLIALNKACEDLRILQNSVSSLAVDLQTLSDTYKQKIQKVETSKENIIKYKANTKAINKAIQESTLKNNNLIEKLSQQLQEIQMELNKEEKIQSNILHKKVELQQKITETANEVEKIKLEIDKINKTSAETYKNMLNRDNATTIAFSSMLESIKKSFML